MTVDEYEALRLMDGEGLTQEAFAARMNIARTTVTAIYESARNKVADAVNDVLKERMEDYYMLVSPEEYIGKTVKMRGLFTFPEWKSAVVCDILA